MPARSSASERLQCPIGLVPFETEGPNKPIALPCSHNISEEQLKLFLNRRASRLNCPLCNHPLPSRTFPDYKPNYGMIDALKGLQEARPADLGAAEAPATPSQQLTPRAMPPPQPVHVHVPGNLSDALPVVGARASSEAPPVATSELEALPSAGSEELAHLWPRVVARYWIDAPEVLGTRASWEPWGLDADGHLVYSALSPSGLRVAVLELKLPPFTQLDACPSVQLRLLELIRCTALARLQPHSIRFVGIGEQPANQRADDSKGLAAGLAVYEMPQACLAEHIADLPQQRLDVHSTMALARMTAAALAEAESNALVNTRPELSSIVVCPHMSGGDPDFRLAPFMRGGHHHGHAFSAWQPPVSLSTLQALCMSREEVEGAPDINVFSSYVWRLAATVVVTGIGLDAFATWQVDEVFAKVLAGAHPDVNATPFDSPVKGILKQCLQADPTARPSAETVHSLLLMCLANEDNVAAHDDSCARVIPPTPPAPAPIAPARPALVQDAPPQHATYPPHHKAPDPQCCALM